MLYNNKIKSKLENMRSKLFLILLMAISGINAKTIYLDEANKIAVSLLGKEVVNVGKPTFETRTIRKNSNAEATDIHIFNAKDGNGFVIISGDDCIDPVLAFSEEGIIDLDSAPEVVKWLISQYQRSISIKELQLDSDRKVATISNPLTRAVSTPLLKTTWNQDTPYNKYCPIINGSHALTGCVATAMAQVINHENKSKSVKTIKEYTTQQHSIDLPPLPAKEFNLGSLSEDEIALLMFYCGQSVEMDYGLEESGAFSSKIPEALYNYFGWESEIKSLQRSNYNDEHWNRMVAEEIAAGHPLIYSAITQDGAGHTFVVDGISNDYFHVNWGWGGIADGYFSFSIFSSENRSDYILMQEMVTTRDDDPSNDVITYGTTINGINYLLQDDSTAVVLPLKNGEKYRGDLVIPSIVEYGGKKYTVNFLGANAFVNCGHLTSIFIPETIKGQDWGIFSGCENLHKVDVEDLYSFIKLDVGAFLDGSPLSYGADLYLNGRIVKDLVIPEGIEVIGYGKFHNCTSIETVVFSSTVREAGMYSFSACPNLKDVDMLGSSLELIDGQAFVNASALEKVMLPETLKTIRGDAFAAINGPGCKNLKKIVCKAIEPPFREGENNIFSLNIYSDVVLYVPEESVKEYRRAKDWGNFVEIEPINKEKPLPKTVTVTIGNIIYEINLNDNFAKVIGTEEIFDGNETIKTIEYQNKSYPVEEIGYRGFYGIDLYEFSMPSHIRKIGIGSFDWAVAHNEFEIPNAVTSIPYQAFRNFSTPKLIIGENVEYIGFESFLSEEFRYDNKNYFPLPEIEIRALTPPVIDEYSFDSHQFQMSTLYVPYGSKKAYKTAPYWSNFKNIKNIGDKQEPELTNDLTFNATIDGLSYLRNGMSLSIKAKIINSGSELVKGFSVKWDIDGKSSEIEKFDVELYPENSYDADLIIPVNVDQAGSHKLTLNLLLLNIQDDDLSDNTVSLDFETFDSGYYRVSLIEQFTSEECGVTPSANPTVFNAIKNTGNSDFVAHVFNHCGFEDDFLTLNRDYEWFYNAGGTYTPAMMLNRTDIDDTGFTPVMPVRDRLEKDLKRQNSICDAMVSMFLEIKDGKGIVKTVLNKTPGFDLDEGYDYVTVYMIEDSIPARKQVDVWTDGYLKNFYHRNVLRKVLSSPWGEVIQWDGDECLYKFETSLDPDWKIENLSAIAFIHRYNEKSPVDCQVLTAGASYLPQYTELPKESANWVTWNSDGLNKISISTISMEGEKNKTNLKPTENLSLSVALSPLNATNKDIEWTAEPEGIVIFKFPETGDNTQISLEIDQYASPQEVVITAKAKNNPSVFDKYVITINNLLYGDANDNGIVTVSDVITIANEILSIKLDKESLNDNFCFVNADIDRNNKIEVVDQASVVNIILNKEYHRQLAYNATRSVETFDYLVMENFHIGYNEIGVRLENADRYINLQVDFLLPEGINIKGVTPGETLNNHILSYNMIGDRILRVLLYSLSNSPFINIESPLFNVLMEVDNTESDIEIKNALATDISINRNELMTRGGENISTTGIYNEDLSTLNVKGGKDEIIIIGNQDEEINIFTLDGRLFMTTKSSSPYFSIPITKGVYLVAVKQMTFKVNVR